MTIQSYLRSCIRYWPLFAALVSASLLFHYWTTSNSRPHSTPTPVYSASSTILALADPSIIKLVYLPLAELRPVLDDATGRLEMDPSALDGAVRAELLQGSYISIIVTTPDGATSARAADAVAGAIVSYSQRLRGSELAGIQAERERWPLAPDTSFGSVVSRPVAVVERAQVPLSPDPAPSSAPWWLGFLSWGLIGAGTAGVVVGAVAGGRLWWTEDGRHERE